MANITILGAGVMGSALAITAASNPANSVLLIGSPLDNDILDSINDNRWHPALKIQIPDNISILHEQKIAIEHVQEADIIVIGVSSPGVEWAVDTIITNHANPDCVALVTKGLVASDDTALPPATYATALTSRLNSELLLGIGGPCIARELAMGIPTAVTFSATQLELANKVQQHFQTDYYRIDVHPDFVGLEACAALKNFYCIGVSAMLGAWKLEGVTAKNPVAALFNQAVLEMNMLCSWIRQPTDTSELKEIRSKWSDIAFDLPGMGDLHVTVGGGRNSKLGTLLGGGQRLSEIIAGPMKGVTVEGLDTGRQLLSGFNHAVDEGILPADRLPLTRGILNSIEHDQVFEFDFKSIPTRT